LSPLSVVILRSTRDTSIIDGRPPCVHFPCVAQANTREWPPSVRRSGCMRRRRMAIAVAVTLLGFVALANVIVVSGGHSSRSARVPARKPRFDCALVLGAGVDDEGRPSQVLEDRLEQALVLFREHEVDRLLVSGDHRTRSYDEPNAMRTWLEARGVP